MSERMLEYFIASWKLIPGSGGVYELTVNDELLFSKKSLGRHAEEGELKQLIQEKVEAYMQQQGVDLQQIADA